MNATNNLTRTIVDKWHKMPEKKWMFILALVIFLANIQIYSVQILVQDDHNYYYFWQKGEFPTYVTLKCIPNTLLTWTASKINFFLARSLVVVGVLIPAILLLFRILRKLEYPLPVALFSSGLLGFSPGQVDIPIFINGSYTAEAMLMMVIALWSGLNFLQDGRKYRWGWFISAIASFYWALIISELVVPSTVALIVCFLCWSHFRKKAWFLSASFALLTFYHTYFHILHNSRNIVKQGKPFTSGGFFKVGQDFVAWCLPTLYIPRIDGKQWLLFITIITAACLVIGMIRGFSSETESNVTLKSRIRPRGEYAWRVIFPILFSISTLVVMTLSPWFSPRHALFPAFGLYLFLSYPVYEAFKKYKYGKALTIVALIWLATGSLIQHYSNTSKLFSPINTMHNNLMKFLMSKEFPPQAQIVVVNMNPRTEGFWNWSTGYLQSSLKRKDVSGLLGNELMLIDPFIPANFTKGGMNGLNSYDPLFIYRRTDDEFEQLTYFLHCKENNIDSEFVIYHTDPATGAVKPLIDGKGWDAYLRVISNLAKRGIARSEIVWGGEVTDKDRQRLDWFPKAVQKDGGNEGRGKMPQVIQSEGFTVSGATLEKGGLGFVLSSNEAAFAVALKKTEMSYKNIMTVKCQIRPQYNGFIVFGETPERIARAGLRIGAKTSVIEGPFLEKVEVPWEIDNNKVYNTTLSINLAEKTIVWKVDGKELKTNIKVSPASVNYVGYSLWNNKTEFSDLQISGN